jgi:uncharacterized protein (TIGR02145 family)
LRWGGGDALANGYSGTNYTDRQWPCPVGYHVPSIGEWWGLITARHTANSSHWGTYNTSNGLSYISGWWAADLANFQADTKLPLAGNRDYGSASTVYNQGDLAFYWSSSSGSPNARSLYLNSSYVIAISNDNRANAFSLRCFQDS